ncbi:GumC family protein [Sphingobium sp.]|uniref:GumC family protein n=1 Tax=Sphingobium sp. TaxID=1912891 RepID=UPI003BB58312
MKISHESEAEEDGFAGLITRARDVVRQRWLTLAVVTVLVFAVAVVLVLMMTPKYTAYANVRIDPSRTPMANEQQQTAQSLSPEAIETEVTLLKSERIARDVVRKLNLGNDEEFNKGLDQPAAAGMTAADRETAVANNVLQRVSVDRDKLSYILNVGFTSKDRQKAADVANAFAQAYIYAKVGSKSDTAATKASFLQAQVTKLADEIRASEAQLANYQAASGLAGTIASSGASTLTIVDQQIAPLSSALAQARSESAAASATLAAANGQSARGGSDTVAGVLASPVIGNLRAQRATLLQNMGEVMARYGERHPETLRVRGQLAEIDAQLKAETDRITASLRANAAAAAARVGSLQSDMDRLGSSQAANARSGVLAKGLEADIESKRTQYEKLSQALQESSQAASNSISSAEVVDAAKPPLAPTSPNKPILLALGFLVALAAGTGTITVQELMVSGIKSSSDLEDKLGLPMLAAIPREKSALPADILMEKPTSLFAESLRIARASILGVKSGKQIKVIAITSAMPSEGKTTTAVAFARTLAMNGQKTLLIDCDVRRAVMRESVRNPSTGPGLVEVLQGEASVEQAINPGDVDNLDHLLVRETHFSSGNLFGDGRMERLLAGLRGRYELIVLDLPPILGLADGRFIAVMADAVAMVLRWNSTPAQAASLALTSLQSDGANVVGVMFTMVDTNSEAIGGKYYSKKYAGYYEAG